jgi:hypothetical protein
MVEKKTWNAEGGKEEAGKELAGKNKRERTSWKNERERSWLERTSGKEFARKIERERIGGKEVCWKNRAGK